MNPEKIAKKIQKIRFDYRELKELKEHYSELEDIVPALKNPTTRFDSNLKALLQTFCKKVDCMESIANASLREVSEHLSSIEEVEKIDNALAGIKPELKNQIEAYFEDEKNAELFKNPAWCIAYSSIMSIDNMSLGKELDTIIENAKTAQQRRDEAEQRFEELREKELKENNRDIKKLNTDIAQLNTMGVLLQEQLKNKRNSKEVSAFISAENFIKSYEENFKGDYDKVSEQDMEKYAKAKETFEMYREKAQKYFEIEKQYKEVAEKYKNLTKERDSVPDLKNILKEISTAKKQQKQMENIDKVAIEFTRTRAEKLYSKKDVNKGRHTNSQEFDDMIKSLNDLRNGSSDLNQRKNAIEKLKLDAEKYLEEKGKQIRIFPSARRTYRIEVAKTLISFAEESLKEMKRPELKAIIEKQAAQQKENEKAQAEKAQAEKTQAKNKLVKEVFEHLM